MVRKWNPSPGNIIFGAIIPENVRLRFALSPLRLTTNVRVSPISALDLRTRASILCTYISVACYVITHHESSLFCWTSRMDFREGVGTVSGKPPIWCIFQVKHSGYLEYEKNCCQDDECEFLLPKVLIIHNVSLQYCWGSLNVMCSPVENC